MSIMEKFLERFPDQCEEAIKIANDIFKEKISSTIPEYRDKKRVVVCGVGGSAAGGDILRDYSYKKVNIPIVINKDYELPAYADSQSLVFVNSYSGNTEETLSSFLHALERKCSIVTITSGGKLYELSEKNKIPCLKIPQGMPPRATFAYLFFPMLIILQKLGYVQIESGEIQETIKMLEELKGRSKDSKKSGDNLTIGLLDKLQNSIPLILTSEMFKGCAWRLKSQLNENSKILAYCNTIPEINHNEIEALSQNLPYSKSVFLLLLRDRFESLRLKKRIDITIRVVRDNIDGIFEIYSEGEYILTRMLSLLHKGDWLSIQLAKRKKIDPIPTPKIDLIKKELGQYKEQI